MANSTHFVSDSYQEIGQVDAVDTSATPRSLWFEAWQKLKYNPLFYISAVLIIFIIFMVAFPGIFTSQDPRWCELKFSSQAPSSDHILGTTLQGCDVWSRVVYGARPSVIIGVMVMLISSLFGALIGALAGYFGGWLDAILGRIVDIFFAIPFILAAIVVLQMFTATPGIWKIIITLCLFGWVSSARMMRGCVLETKSQEFITASKALGVSKMKILISHVFPNSFAPLIVTSTTSLGTYIVAEATLSFLGLGLDGDAVSWGIDISNARDSLVTNPALLLYPASALAITVLAFIFLGDAVREALDPKARS